VLAHRKCVIAVQRIQKDNNVNDNVSQFTMDHLIYSSTKSWKNLDDVEKIKQLREKKNSPINSKNNNNQPKALQIRAVHIPPNGGRRS
jgi:hypothetical protein